MGKMFFEKIGTALTFGDETKIQRNIDLAETRLAEAIAMSEKGKPIIPIPEKQVSNLYFLGIGKE